MILNGANYNKLLKKQIKLYSDLRIKRISKNSWYVFSIVYKVDYWIIELNESEREITLLHANSRNVNGCKEKISCHIQCVVGVKKYKWILQRINSHNLFHLKNKTGNMNLVDRVLSNNKQWHLN